MIANIVTGLRIALLIPLYLLLAALNSDLALEDEGAALLRWWALGVFLAAGLTDVVDGWLARKLNQTSAFGAMLDLIADRLLTLVAVAGLLTAGLLGPFSGAAAVFLLARDVIVSALNEALPGKLAIRVSWLERIKIAFQIIALALYIAPPLAQWGSRLLAEACIYAAALLALVTLVDYARRALRAFRQG